MSVSILECRYSVIGSPEINKVIRRTLSPALRATGFMHVQTRNNWAWYGDVIWVLNIRAVGYYFSRVTGWPPMSVCVWLGTFYTFFPVTFSIKRHSDGRLLPEEWICQMRSHLSCALDQTALKARLDTEPEKRRSDIWWIEPDGSNVKEVIENIRDVYLTDGTRWFQQMSDLNYAFRQIEQGRDCWDKFHRATYFARRLGDKSKFEQYRTLWIAEAQRKDLPYDVQLDAES
jgi:hypothetical protein